MKPTALSFQAVPDTEVKERKCRQEGCLAGVLGSDETIVRTSRIVMKNLRTILSSIRKIYVYFSIIKLP